MQRVLMTACIVCGGKDVMVVEGVVPMYMETTPCRHGIETRRSPELKPKRNYLLRRK